MVCVHGQQTDTPPHSKSVHTTTTFPRQKPASIRSRLPQGAARDELSRTIRFFAFRYPSRHLRGRLPRSQSCVCSSVKKGMRTPVLTKRHFWTLNTQLGGRRCCLGLTLATSPSGPCPRSSLGLDPNACKTKMPTRSGSQFLFLPKKLPTHDRRPLLLQLGWPPAALHNRRVSAQDGNSGNACAKFCGAIRVLSLPCMTTTTTETQPPPELQARRLLHARGALRARRHEPR